ncbi:MAG TPA: YdiU family protein [Caldilineaceae bacterium]|nr:YdiU family protein [Caldilineaceae bacterium]
MTLQFNFDNSYARELEGFYVPWEGAKVPDPAIVKLNEPLAEELQLIPAELKSTEGAAILAGAAAPTGATPLAQAYAGHQFGGFSPQLGDGRALLIGEVIDRHGRRRDIHLKGSGRTPFSRGGDGKAVLGPVLREYLMGEAMYALGIPTTRALAAVTTGETIYREGPQPGAVLARVASSHLRVGTFQYFAAHGGEEKIRQLADYAIQRHYPELADAANPYVELFRAVRDRQAQLVAQWMSVGFIHGVMNTDNMAISGETIDYGPCAFMDAYNPKTVFSSIDTGGRYAYGNQPGIAQWNLARFAETLLPLIDANQEDAVRIATAELHDFADAYRGYWLAAMRQKLGLTTEVEGDLELVNDLLTVLAEQEVDFTKFFRRLAKAVVGDSTPVRALFADDATIQSWLARWQQRVQSEETAATERAAAMTGVNPVYIPRNHKVEEALQAATAGDMTKFETLLAVLAAPFTEEHRYGEYAEPAPESFGRYVTYCGT